MNGVLFRKENGKTVQLDMPVSGRDSNPWHAGQAGRSAVGSRLGELKLLYLKSRDITFLSAN